MPETKEEEEIKEKIEKDSIVDKNNENCNKENINNKEEKKISNENKEEKEEMKDKEEKINKITINEEEDKNNKLNSNPILSIKKDIKDNEEEDNKLENINNKNDKENETIININKEIIEIKDIISNENNKNEEKDNEEKEKGDFEEYENWADAPIEDSSDEEEESEEKNNLNNSKEEDNKKNINNDKKNINNNEIEIKDNLKNENENENVNNDKIKEEIEKLVNTISLVNYHEIKNKLKPLLNNNISNQELFIDFVYKYSLEQLSFQKIFSNLFKDIYFYLYNNKNNLKYFRKKLIEKCKRNLLNKKICEDNRNIINNNISLIAELINSKIFPKKAGLKCLKYLLNKFKKNSDLNKNDIKYMYLECILLLLKTFCCNIYNYQKERIHNEFDEEITKIIEELKNIIKDEKNKDIPNYTKHLLINLLEKAENKWELQTYEKNNYESHFKVFNNDDNYIIEEKN